MLHRGSTSITPTSSSKRACSMHALATADQDVGEPAGWIPIREGNSPPPPFDFASERILYIPRSICGELNETKLRQMLADRIGALLRES